MGGLLSLAAVNELPDEIFDSVLFCGTPFACGVGMLEDLSPKTAASFLNYKTCFTFPSVYAFFPLLHDEYHLFIFSSYRLFQLIIFSVVMGVLKDYKTKAPMEFDFTNPQCYFKYGLLGFQNQNPTNEEIQHLTHCLKNCAHFKERMRFKNDKKYPVFGVFSGNTVMTKVFF